MSLTPENDPIHLIKKIVLKDKEAFGRFYDLLSPLAFTLIFRVLKSKPDAEEILQDVFYYVWEKAANFNASRGTPQAWVITIARSRAIDRLRSRQRIPQGIEIAEGMPENSFFADSTGQNLIHSRDDRAFLAKELEGLSDIQQQALELAYFDGLTQTEIAERLELPLGTVKTRLRDGLKKLKEIMEKKKVSQS